MADLRVDIAAEFTGKKAFSQADKATGSLSKSVLKLAKYLGPAALGAALAKFGKDSVKAFVEDQKQAAKLANVVKNLGLEFSNPSIASYIDKLTLATGVSDTKLRPAFQALISTTGDVTKSQELLKQAIDVSAGSGVDLTQVAQDLSNAYVGKTKALAKYNLGLTQAELKTAKFADIQKKLNDLYKGSNAAYLNTYAGKMEALSNAAGEASEKIGGALIDSLMSLTGSMTIQDLIDQIDILADKTAGWIDQFTAGIKAWTSIGKAFKENFLSINPNYDKLNSELEAIQKERRDKWLRRNYMKAWDGIKTPGQIAAEKKAAADAAKRAKEIAAAQDKQTKELKKQAALKKAGTVFDLQQIGIVAALQGKITEDEKLRLQAQAAILNGNDVLASSLTKQILMAQDASGKLYQYFLTIGDTKIKNPFEFLDKWIVEFQDKLNNLKFPTPPTSGGIPGFTPSTIYPVNPLNPGDPGFIGPVIPKTNVPSSGVIPGFSPDTSIFGTPTGPIQGPQVIELKITGDGDLTNTIARNLMQQSLSTGNQTYVNRRTGGFE